MYLASSPRQLALWGLQGRQAEGRHRGGVGIRQSGGRWRVTMRLMTMRATMRMSMVARMAAAGWTSTACAGNSSGSRQASRGQHARSPQNCSG